MTFLYTLDIGPQPKMHLKRETAHELTLVQHQKCSSAFQMQNAVTGSGHSAILSPKSNSYLFHLISYSASFVQ